MRQTEPVPSQPGSAALAPARPVNDVFAVRPAKSAVVSEISEATASSPVPPEQRVNFHIGNPVQDSRLIELYARIALGLECREFTPENALASRLLDELGWDDGERGKLEYLLEALRRSAPYLPRGGFLKNRPGELMRLFGQWVGRDQPEPLAYDFGEKTGRREVVLASGGITEALRVFFHALSRRLQHLPAFIHAHAFRLAAHLTQFDALRFQNLPEPGDEMVDALIRVLQEHPASPSFVLLGRVLPEETRRSLRVLVRDHPLFVVEVNDAPNHESLAREARMMNCTLRFLTPGIFDPTLKALSTVFVAGYHEFVSIIETMHFQLKGTPSAAEVELLTYLLKLPHGSVPRTPDPGVYQEEATVFPALHGIVNRVASRLEEHVETLAAGTGSRMESVGPRLERSVGRFAPRRIGGGRTLFVHDAMAGVEFREIMEQVALWGDSVQAQHDLSESFKAVFLQHHPEYRADASIVVSGSARTALGMLGFHCGVREVVIPDLSWTYEHCFPLVTSVPLTPAYELDAKRMTAVVSEKLRTDSGWREHGAVVFNNPHNATGQVFSEDTLREVLRYFLAEGVRVIDDLSYQNVAPAAVLKGPATLRQLADELVRTGYLSSEQASRVVAVHSLSKTDCLAGARLSVVEIRDPVLRERFDAVNRTIAPNCGAILLAYLFYRSSAQQTNAYWTTRNRIFDERMTAIEQAAGNLPPDRNRFHIAISRPAGSMYPRMTIESLPPGISLDWIASRLARQGIGLIPLSTFAHTEEGFEIGRKAFRLTLGGTDGADRLLPKTRRVLIDLNRVIAEEESHYNRKSLHIRPARRDGKIDVPGRRRAWGEFTARVAGSGSTAANAQLMKTPDAETGFPAFERFLAGRLEVFRTRFEERLDLACEWLALAESEDGRRLEALLEQELYRDDLGRRERLFRQRLYDRTVHPTQMYSVPAELLWQEAIDALVSGRTAPAHLAAALGNALAREFFGLNVAVNSQEEANELLLDLDTALSAEECIRLRAGGDFTTFLSYWGDWDGSNRPSGQGHRLVATVLMENVARMGRLFRLMLKTSPGLQSDPQLIQEVEKLPVTNRRFRALFDQITDLTHQLERRYRGVLPSNVQPGPVRKLGMRLHLAADPLVSLWQHNDRLERRMLELRRKRKRTLEYYFALNKRLRKTLRLNLGVLRKNSRNTELLLAAAGYRDLLRRFVITPRIHQNMITSADPFAIDTTVHNITEINDVAARNGNPGMVLALQVSMSSDPEALISLDRKLRAKREEAIRGGCADVPSVALVPLYEDVDIVRSIPAYLGKIWDYALQSRRLNETTEDRFSEIIGEVFIAGSDLSQQIGQTAGLALYKKASYDIVRWLAERSLVGQVRIKLGSGEPMQRQGGYHAPLSGRPAFINTPENESTLAECVEPSAKRSTRYATTPLMGIFASGDLRTFQSNLSERLRHLPVDELAQVLHHVSEAQSFSSSELRRAAEPLTDTRLQFTTRGLQELERLTVGAQDALFDDFMKLATENFRQILYGREEDVVGIYAVSYFIARTIPSLRDRPTVRPAPGPSGARGQQILERIAATIPFSRYGSSLRAIAHHQAQTFVLGINQLTTGLFRALSVFAQTGSGEGDGEGVLADRILPHLPVYEILNSLRIYQDVELRWLALMERGFPAGNSAFTILREDADSIRSMVPLFQKELVRRHGVTVSDFFEGNRFIPRLLPTLRPDLAVLLQPDLFNTEAERILERSERSVQASWRSEVERLLRIPQEIALWRRKAWRLLEQPVYARVASFVELATALHSVAQRAPAAEVLSPPPLPRKLRDTVALLRGPAEDSLQQFLVAAFEYLSALPKGSVELPTNLVKALKEVERIIRIEEQALPARDQDLLRFYLLQIARTAGDNG